MKYRWVRQPVITELNLFNLYENPPLNPYKGEYPRFLIDPHPPFFEYKWVKLFEDGSIK